MSLTSSKRLTIQVETVSVGATTPTILSYSIDVDDGKGGDIFSIFGEYSDTLSTVANLFNVVKGRVYRTRYRVKNAVGWSEYSPMGYLRSADVPSAPPAPTTVSASASEIALAM